MGDDALIIVALLWLALFVFLGWKYSEKRLRWAFSDLAWLGIGIFGFVSLYNKIPDAQEFAYQQSVVKQALIFKQNLHYSLWKIDDRYCSSGVRISLKLKMKDKQVICNFVHRSYRELTSPIFDNYFSDQLNKQIQQLCKTACDSDFENFKDRLTTYSNYVDKNRDRLEPNEYSRLKNQIPLYLVAIALFIFAYGFRLGRSMAEISRELKNYRERSSDAKK